MVDEALLGTLGEVRTALEDVLERTDRAVEEADQEALGEGPAGEAPAAPKGPRPTPRACYELG
jgi:hypothetical protein